MATILLIEPHPLLRLGLRHLLAQASIPGDLVELDDPDLIIASGPDPWLTQADLLIYGLGADLAAGWSTLDRVCTHLQPQRALVLSNAWPPLPELGLPAPVRGFLSKDCGLAVLEAAVRLVLAGGECFPYQLQMGESAAPAMAATAPPPRGAASVMPLVAGTPAAHGLSALSAANAIHAGELPETPTAGAHLLNITERQYEVLALLSRGYPIKTVSHMLNISVATAKTHACTLYQRLQVRNKGEAVYVALQRGAMLNWPGPAAA